jgi:hypothetical protein
MLTDLISMNADLQERALCYMKMADETIAGMVKCLWMRKTSPVSQDRGPRGRVIENRQRRE